MTEIVAHFSNILKVYSGDEAWRKVLELRYSPGRARTHTKSLFKRDSKENSILILFHNKTKKTIEYRFYLDTNNVPDINDESDVNMFGGFFIEKLGKEPDAPAFIRKLEKFLKGLLEKK